MGRLAAVCGGAALVGLLVAVVTLSAPAPAPRRFGLEQAMHKHIGAAFERALVNKPARVALKAQLTMLCDQGRSHPEYWALKGMLDKVSLPNYEA